MAFLLEAQLQSLCEKKKIPPNKNMSEIEMYAGFSVTFDTPCNLVRFPANEPLQCVSSVVNIWLRSCKWSSCEAKNGTCIAAGFSCPCGRTASTGVELQGGGPAASFSQTNCGIGKIWMNGWAVLGNFPTGGEIPQTKICQILVGHNWNIIPTSEIQYNGHPYGLEKLLEAKKISAVEHLETSRSTKFTYQRITSMLII